MRNFLTLLVLLCSALVIPAQSSAGTQLQIYFIDVEGGQSTLFVTPEGKSLLIDTGWAGNNSRDADRIAAAAKAAGIAKIDYVLITHFHDDHVGGVPQLVQRIPVGAFIDHGPNRELTPDVNGNFDAYQKTLASGHYKRIIAKPGETLPISGIHVQVISADGKLIDKPLDGAGQPNEYCKASETRPADQTENARSVGVLMTFGKLRILDLGDLTWDKEMQLMCPDNKLGKVDVLIVSHHGWNQSSSPALVDAIQARIAIMDNGAKKGGSTPVLDTVRKAPGLETLWQLHFSEEGGTEHNTADEYDANFSGGADQGNYLKLTASPDGSFAVFNSRTQQSKSYAAR
ncbi:ComEC/Rec2 family competence protein [Acidisarcina polymorpha]|nr:MBL fold metallo-hydrolase [Acidisarcina polymorpha]